MEAEEKDLSKILRRVQQFINVAEGSNHNVPDSAEWHALDTEQKLAREKADALMLAYAITEATAEAAKPITERMKPLSEEFESGTGDLRYHIERLAAMLEKFTRTKIRWNIRWDNADKVYMHRVYGYESDVRYFTFLYTTLRLHFVGALRPQIEQALSLEENCYNLHNAGFGWREIAKMYGWTTKRYDMFGDEMESWRTKESGETEAWFSPEGVKWEGETRIAVRPYRSAYFRECKKRGEEPIKNIVPEAFRADAADGYTHRLRARLRDVEEKRKVEGGSALALRIDDLEQFVRQESGNCTKCPACGMLSLYTWQCDVCGNTEGMEKPPEGAKPCEKCAKAKSGSCREHTYRGGRTRYRKFSEAGYQAGVRQANSADLGGQRTSHVSKKEIG